MSKTDFELFTVYKSPADYPGLYVVRRFVVTGQGGPTPDPEPFLVGSNLQKIRAELFQLGLTALDRSPHDEPHIVETWL